MGTMIQTGLLTGSVRRYPPKIPVILCSRYFSEATSSYKCSEADTA
jgi:hypothetical protein